jgi:hypothetical protein
MSVSQPEMADSSCSITKSQPISATSDNSLPPPSSLPIRLIKSMPKIKSDLDNTNKSASDSNGFLRTPTKGGASAFNLNMLDSLTSNGGNTNTGSGLSGANTSSSLLNPNGVSGSGSNPALISEKNEINKKIFSKSSGQQNDKVLHKIEINNHSNDYYTFHDDQENSDQSSKNMVFNTNGNHENVFNRINRNTSNGNAANVSVNNPVKLKPNQVCSDRNGDEEEVIFRPLIKEGDQAANKKIKVTFLDSYKLKNSPAANVNSKSNGNNLGANQNENSQIDEKDLVSKRLRETINSDNDVCNRGGALIKPTFLVNKPNINKKFKRDELVDALTKHLDSNSFNNNNKDSFIIIDSDNDDLSFETNITSDCSSMNQIKKDPLVEDEAKEAKSFEKESLDSCSKNGKI